MSGFDFFHYRFRTSKIYLYKNLSVEHETNYQKLAKTLYYTMVKYLFGVRSLFKVLFKKRLILPDYMRNLYYVRMCFKTFGALHS